MGWKETRVQDEKMKPVAWIAVLRSAAVLSAHSIHLQTKTQSHTRQGVLTNPTTATHPHPLTLDFEGPLRDRACDQQPTLLTT